MNFLKDLFSPEDYTRYQLTLYPFNLSILDKALKAKLAEDPEYEVFVPLVYYKYLDLIKDKELPMVLAPYKYFISNKGRIVSLRGKEPFFIGTTLSSYGYQRFNVQIAKKQIKLLFHRAIACSFVPLKDELGPWHPKDLVVNHMDGIKINCDLGNLEWCTELENKEHAKATGLMQSGEDHYSIKPVKGTVLIGKFKGLEFLLIGTKAMAAHGFFAAAISRCCLSKAPAHRNCSFAFATDKEIYTLPRGLAHEVVTDVFEIGKGVVSDIIATHLETGNILRIRRGKPELIELGFDESAVTKVIKGKLKTHKGYVFERVDAA